MQIGKMGWLVRKDIFARILIDEYSSKVSGVKYPDIAEPLALRANCFVHAEAKPTRDDALKAYCKIRSTAEFAAVDAVGNADAGVGVAGEFEIAAIRSPEHGCERPVLCGPRDIAASCRANGRYRQKPARRECAAAFPYALAPAAAVRSSGISANSGRRAPPTNTRSSVFPSGARWAYFRLLKLTAKIGLCSMAGTTAPMPSSGWPICRSSYPSETIAVPECLMAANSAANSASSGSSSFAVTGEGVARTRASKSPSPWL